MIFLKMALCYDLMVFKDVCQLILKIFEYTKDFPREYKYTLGQDMKRDAVVLVRSIDRANKAKSKTEYLETFLDDFEILKLEIRLCVDMKILSIKKQSEIALLMDGIGKQITGWRNADLQDSLSGKPFIRLIIKKSVGGLKKPPAREFFMVLYYDLPAFNQCEMGAKKIKRQDFIIEVSTFFIIFYPNRYQLFLLTFDTLFQFHHSCKSCESRLLASTTTKSL